MAGGFQVETSMEWLSLRLKGNMMEKKMSVSSDSLILLSQREFKPSSLQLQIFHLKANITIFIMLEKQLVNLIVHLHSHMNHCKVSSDNSVEIVIRIINQSFLIYCILLKDQ